MSLQVTLHAVVRTATTEFKNEITCTGEHRVPIVVDADTETGVST
jgi:hypothetical protein